MPRYAPLFNWGLKKKKQQQQKEDILRSKRWTNRQWIKTLFSPLTCLIKCKNQMIVWASIYQAHDVQSKKNNMFLPHDLKKTKTSSGFTCFCYVQRRMSTHKQSYIQTNRRHPRLSLVSQQKQMRSVFGRNSTHYSDGLSSVCGNCCYKWIRGNKWLYLKKRPQCANESHAFGLNTMFCVCMCV